MKIKKISFNGDEIFKNLTIDFMNPKTNSPFSTIIIIGENGAGKSNLLKSLSKSDLFRVPQSNGNKIEYEEQQHQNYPVFLNNENINNNNIHSEPKLEFGKKENIKYDVTEILKSFLEQAAFNTYEIINKSPEVINRDELLNEGAKNIKYIQKILNDFFEDDGLKFTDKYSKTTSIQFLKNNVELTYNVLSDGEKKILTNVAKILSCGDSISSTPILIDEPEEKLHFIWQTKILDFYQQILTFKQHQTQLIISTHSEHVLRSAFFKEDVMILILKNKNGEIETEKICNFNEGKPYSYEELIYNVYNYATNDYFNQLYSLVEEKIKSSNHKEMQKYIEKFKDWFEQKTIRYVADVKENRDWGDINELIYYRQQIHHPNNFEKEILDSEEKIHINKKIDINNNILTDFIEKLKILLEHEPVSKEENN